MEAMTGDVVSHFEFENNKWQKMKLVHLESKENKRKCALEDVEGEKHSSDDVRFLHACITLFTLVFAPAFLDFIYSL
jgi:hypothetical protein